MPLISQCSSCPKNDTEKCPYYGADKKFDGLKCPDFQVSLAAREDFSAGLVLFSCAIVVSGLFTLAVALVNICTLDYPIFWLLLDAMTGILLTAFSVCAAVSVWKKKSNAYFLSMAFFLIP